MEKSKRRKKQATKTQLETNTHICLFWHPDLVQICVKSSLAGYYASAWWNEAGPRGFCTKIDTQGHGPPTQKTQIDTDTKRRKQINVCINKRQTRATTLDGVRVGYNRIGRRTDADACSLALTKGYNGGAAGSTRAFLEAARASPENLHRKKRWS